MKESKQISAPLTDLIYGKIPPQNKDLEKSVLGAIMIEKGAFDTVSGILSEEDFYAPEHSKIFSAVKRLSNKSMAIDLLTVIEELKSKGDLESVGGPYYITRLTNEVSSTAHLETHCRLLYEKRIQRGLITVGGMLINNGYNDEKDVFDMLEEGEKNLYDLVNKINSGNFVHISQGIVESIEKLASLRNREHVLTGVPTGFPEIDRITNGWQNNDLIIIAARPSVGKSCFALNLACNAAFSETKPTGVGIFSLEMSRQQLIDRILSSETKIPLDWIQSGSISDGKMIQLEREAGDRISEAPIYIDDTPGLSLFNLRSKCRRLKSKHGVGLIIIDYLQLMYGDKKKGNREQEIADISRQLKALAKELEIPVIALSQLSREVEKRNGIPRLSDLRESGSIEQDADIVMFLYRPSLEEQKRDPDLRNTGTALIAKHRNGQLGSIEMYIDLSIQKWFDWNEGQEYERTFDKKLIPIESTFYNEPEQQEPDDEIPF